MALKNAYDYIKKLGFEFNIDFPIGCNVSYSCEDEIASLKDDLKRLDGDTLINISYAPFNGAIVFKESSALDKNYITVKLKDVLNIMLLQNDIFNETLEELLEE